MTSLAKQRLSQERKAWRKDHPHGFVAKPITSRDGSVQMLKWTCQVPGKAGTPWEHGLYPVTLEFTEDYPSKPPRVAFPQGFFHPNVYPSGKVCLSILNEEKAWKPSITVGREPYGEGTEPSPVRPFAPSFRAEEPFLGQNASLRGAACECGFPAPRCA